MSERGVREEYGRSEGGVREERKLSVQHVDVSQQVT